MRIEVGEVVKATNFRGKIADIKIKEVNKKQKLIKFEIITQQIHPNNRSQILIQSLIDKPYLEKLFEILPLTTFRKVVIFDSDRSIKYQPNLNRLTGILERSGQQCETPWLPEIEFCHLRIDDILDSYPNTTALVCQDQLKTLPTLADSISILQRREESIPVFEPSVMIGPEGGWSKIELETFGRRIIPTETWDGLVYPSWISGLVWILKHLENNN